MRNRPWPLVLLAMSQILAPLMNTALGAWFQKVSMAEYFLNVLRNGSTLQILDYLAFEPLCGLAILYMKLWVYPIFIILQLWALGNNLLVWLTHFQGTSESLYVVFVCLVNIGLVTCYLMPQVRVFFFNQRVRWWEAKPRYHVGVEGSIKKDQTTHPCTIDDLSLGGIFLKNGPSLALGDMIRVSFRFHENELSLQGRVIHEKGGGNYGIQFVEYDRQNDQTLKRMVKALSLLGKATNRNQESTLASFWNWFSRLLSTGKGLLPEINSKNTIKRER